MGLIFTLVSIGISLGVSILGFRWARNFVSRKLRYVDAAQGRFVPAIAGLAAGLLLLPIAAFLPIIGWGTAASLGIAVGLGVASASRDIRLATYHIDR